jgi:hypothetical protein
MELMNLIKKVLLIQIGIAEKIITIFSNKKKLVHIKTIVLNNKVMKVTTLIKSIYQIYRHLLEYKSIIIML